MQNFDKAQLHFYARALKNAILFSSSTKLANSMQLSKNNSVSKSADTSTNSLSKALKTSFT